MVTWSVTVVWTWVHLSWKGPQKIAAFMFYKFIDGLLKTHSTLPVICSVICLQTLQNSPDKLIINTILCVL